MNATEQSLNKEIEDASQGSGFAYFGDAAPQNGEQLQRNGRFDAIKEDLRLLLHTEMETLARELLAGELGEPKRVSQGLRFGPTGKVLVHTRGTKVGKWDDFGAGEGGDVFALIRRQLGFNSFPDALEWAANRHGIDIGQERSGPSLRRSRLTDEDLAAIKAKQEADRERAEADTRNKQRDAQSYWGEAEPLRGSLGEAYLANRRLCAAAAGEALRFHPVCPYDRTGRAGPAILQQISDLDGNLIGIQRVFLDPRDLTRTAPVRTDKSESHKKMLGRAGGGAVHLAPAGPRMVIGEGVETVLSVMKATGLPGWACLSAGELERFVPPEGVDELIIAADLDKGSGTGKAKAEQLVARLATERPEVTIRIALPPDLRPEDDEGDTDFNDVLCSAPSEAEGLAAVRTIVQTTTPLIATGAPYTAHGAPHFPAPADDLDEAVERLKAAVADWGAGRGPLRPLINGSQGLGKTRTVLEMIASHPADSEDLNAPKVWLMLVPTLEKADEIVKLDYPEVAGPDSVPAVVVRGRTALDPDKPGERMCLNLDLVREWGALEMNVERNICDRECPMRDQCGYMKQKKAIRELKAGLFVSVHERAHLGSAPAPDPDMVIVDESAVGKFLNDKVILPAGVLDNTTNGRWMSFADDWYPTEVSQKIMAAMRDHPGRELDALREWDVSREDLAKGLKSIRARVQGRAYAILKGCKNDRPEGLNTLRNSILAKVLALFERICEEMGGEAAGLSGVRYVPDYRMKGKVEPAVMVCRRREVIFDEFTPVLLLDGTGDLELNRKIWGEDVEEIRCAAERDAFVVQATGRSFSTQSITGVRRDGKTPVRPNSVEEAKDLRQQIVEFVDRLGDPERILVVATKKVLKVLKPELPEATKTAHFNALRGLNAFESCHTVIVIGREQPSPGDMEDQARAFLRPGDAPISAVKKGYVKTTRARRMRSGLSAAVKNVPCHPDPKVQSLLEQVREAECCQAIDRVRAMFEHKRIFVLNDLALDLTVDRIVNWNELWQGTRLERALSRIDTRAEAMPLNAPWLARKFPDLWGSQKAAERYMARLESDPHSPNHKTYMICDLGVTLQYRRKGSGQRTWAVFNGDLRNAREALETAIGAEVRELPRVSFEHVVSLPAGIEWRACSE